jgi:predicted RNA binding protein YcfA (HicA-like mRNA interferase family)
MPPLSQLPGNVQRKKFAKALQRLGFVIDRTGGKGSYMKLVWPATQKSITVQQDLRKDVLKYLLDDIEKYSGITWEDIKKLL